jgi:hypothetical protein
MSAINDFFGTCDRHQRRILCYIPRILRNEIRTGIEGNMGYERLHMLRRVTSRSNYFNVMFRIVFWDVLPCKIIVDRRFRGAYCLHHHPWWWRKYVPLKRRSTIILDVSTSQKTILNIILAAVRTWNLTYFNVRWHFHTSACDTRISHELHSYAISVCYTQLCYWWYDSTYIDRRYFGSSFKILLVKCSSIATSTCQAAWNACRQ